MELHHIGYVVRNIERYASGLPGILLEKAVNDPLQQARCLVPAFDGVIFSHQWKDALWDRFYTGAPARQRQSVEQYNIVKRA